MGKGLDKILGTGTTTKVVTGYKTLTADMSSFTNTDCKWRLGEWKMYPSVVEVCESGFHASRDLYDLLNECNVLGNRLFEVEARGEIKEGHYTFAASEMRIVKEIDAKRLYVDYALQCAKHVLPLYAQKYPTDNQPGLAIEAAEKWLANPTDENADSARTAAQSIGRSITWSDSDSAKYAGVAVWSISMSINRSAVESSIWSSKSAEFAAMSAVSFEHERKYQRNLLKKLAQKYQI